MAEAKSESSKGFVSNVTNMCFLLLALCVSCIILGLSIGLGYGFFVVVSESIIKWMLG